MEKCICNINGHPVKDSTARTDIEEIKQHLPRFEEHETRIQEVESKATLCEGNTSLIHDRITDLGQSLENNATALHERITGVADSLGQVETSLHERIDTIGSAIDNAHVRIDSVIENHKVYRHNIRLSGSTVSMSTNIVADFVVFSHQSWRYNVAEVVAMLRKGVATTILIGYEGEKVYLTNRVWLNNNDLMVAGWDVTGGISDDGLQTINFGPPWDVNGTWTEDGFTVTDECNAM